jgi:CDP-paratose 2-epimerase
LVLLQTASYDRWDGRVYNVGGGNGRSVSLKELTAQCAAETGRRVPIASVDDTAGVDLRIYVSDTRRVASDFDWQPNRTVASTVRDICLWIHEHRNSLANVLA